MKVDCEGRLSFSHLARVSTCFFLLHLLPNFSRTMSRVFLLLAAVVAVASASAICPRCPGFRGDPPKCDPCTPKIGACALLLLLMSLSHRDKAARGWGWGMERVRVCESEAEGDAGGEKKIPFSSLRLLLRLPLPIAREREKAITASAEYCIALRLCYSFSHCSQEKESDESARQKLKT